MTKKYTLETEFVVNFILPRILLGSLFFILLLFYSCTSTKYYVQQAAFNNDLQTLYNFTLHEKRPIRILAMKKLAEIDDEKVIPFLILASRNKDIKIATIAIKRYGYFNDNLQIQDDLIELLKKISPHSELALPVVKSLSEVLLLKPELGKGLGKYLDRYYSASDGYQKIYTAKCFALTGKLKGIQDIEEYVLGDYFAYKLEALKVIGLYHQKKDIPILQHIVQNGDSEERQLANKAIHQIENALNLYSVNKTNLTKEDGFKHLRLIGRPEVEFNEIVARRDANGRFCAAIKIISNLDGFSYDSYNGIVGNIEDKPGVDVIYVSPDERVIEIFHSGYEMLKIYLPELGIHLKPKRMWKIKIEG